VARRLIAAIDILSAKAMAKIWTLSE